FDITLNPVYLEKAGEIVMDFVHDGSTAPDAWSDPHAVAFRSMFLVKAWWQLRTYNLMTYEDSQDLLRSIEEHAHFLEDPNNNEITYNHGINQGAALYLIASNFPELDHDDEWAEVAVERLSSSVMVVVDEDGVLVENSPYYHLNALEKYWQIYSYADRFGPPISNEMESRILAMIRVSAYFLEPDRSIPLLGASIERTVNHFGLY